MSRVWTARKLTTLNEAALCPAAAAYPVFRAGPDRAEAGKQTLRLITAFSLVGLPAHCLVCWLAAHSLGLASAAVLVTAAALFAVAVARWLGLDDLLQRLPLLLVLGLAGVALVYFTSLPPSGGLGTGGFEMMGGFLLLIVAVSVLGGLYRPLAAAYQSLTLRVPFRDLCVAAAGLLASLGLAALGRTLPREALPLLIATLGGAFAGLVVVEYAAWARSNPACDLGRVMAFAPRRPKPAGAKTGKKPADWFRPWEAVLGATLAGVCYGLVSDALFHGVGPASGLYRLYPPSATRDPAATAELLNVITLMSFPGLPFGLVWASATLKAGRLPNPLLALRLAWDALTVFLTYPNTAHPLAHRLHFAWLRPPVVRLTLTGVVLLTAATAIVTPPKTPQAAATETKATAPAAPTQPPQFGPGWDADAPFRRSLDPAARWGGPMDAPPPWLPPAAAPEPKAPSPTASGPGVLAYAQAALVAAVAGPLFLVLMVGFVGASVLPVYYRHFEQPAPPAKPC